MCHADKQKRMHPANLLQQRPQQAVRTEEKSVEAITSGVGGLKLESAPAIPIQDLNLSGIARALNSGIFRKVIVMAGAGISVAAGIPDFRSPGTGLYSQLQKYNLPFPEAVFSIDYFRHRPSAFCTLAAELLPGKYEPTAAHFFIRLLHEKGLLLRCFTQNIDTLEREAGLPGEAVVEAHGSFAAAHCIDCKAVADIEKVLATLRRAEVPRCERCNGLAKPDIVFFGESLPDRFFELRSRDFPQADLLIIMGTSLQVQPFASLVDRVSPTCVRLLLNRDPVGLASDLDPTRGLRFMRADNVRDCFRPGDVQEAVRELCRLAGWEDDLNRLIEAYRKKAAEQRKQTEDAAAKAKETAPETAPSAPQKAPAEPQSPQNPATVQAPDQPSSKADKEAAKM